MRCPQCLASNNIDVTAHVDVRLTRSGSDADASRSGDHEWDAASAASCGCGFAGTVADFLTYQCQNCLAVHNHDKMIVPVPDLEKRLEPGDRVPDGECPACGAVCHQLEDSDDLEQEADEEDREDTPDNDDGGVSDVEIKSLPGDDL